MVTIQAEGEGIHYITFEVEVALKNGLKIGLEIKISKPQTMYERLLSQRARNKG